MASTSSLSLWPRRPSLFKGFYQNPEEEAPETWFNSSIEIVLLDVLLGWIIMLSYDWEFVQDNALLQRLGYNPPGIAMVSAPAIYVTPVIFSVAMYAHCRYCYLDNMRCQLSDATPSQKFLTYIANIIEAFSWLCFPLVFVLTPDKDALTSFCVFSCVVIGNLMGMLMNFHEADKQYHKFGSWIYMAFLAIFSIIFPVCGIVQLISYNEETQELGPIPVWFCAAAEYGWYFLLSLQTRFMPAAPSLHFESKIVEDDDFKSPRPSLQKSHSDAVALANDKRRILGILRILKSPWDVVSPEIWFSASSEVMTICFIVSWTITAIFNRDLIHDNALMQRLGYNNICVAWDAPPALYPASIIFSLALYCQLRFCYLDNLRCVLSEDATPSQKRWTKIGNIVQGGSWCVFPLVYVITPDQSALAHSSAFVCMIFGNLFGMSMNFYEMDSSYHKKYSWAYMAYLVLFSLGFPAVVVLQLLTYNEETEELGPTPLWLSIVLDYGWFIAMAVQSKFMPAAPSIRFKCKLVEDKDFKFAVQKISPYECPDDSEVPDEFTSGEDNTTEKNPTGACVLGVTDKQYEENLID